MKAKKSRNPPKWLQNPGKRDRPRSLLHANHSPTSRDWADDDDVDESQELPPPVTHTNKDGTTTTISYQFNDNGQKVKTTRRIRIIKRTEKVNPRVADRWRWPKFGNSATDAKGPISDTTSVGENIIFRPSVTWKKDAKDEANDVNAQEMRSKLKDKQVKCRICSGDHFTARCPYKDTMAPAGEVNTADVAAGMGDEPFHASAANAGGAGAGLGAASAGGKKGSYVPPAMRAGGAATSGTAPGSKYERDDLATLRVTNVGFLPPRPDFHHHMQSHGC